MSEAVMGAPSASNPAKKSYFDRKASIAAAALFATIGASMFMIEPLFVGALMEHRGFTGVEVGSVVAAELAGNSLAAIAAVFWSTRISWRLAGGFGIIAAVLGNIATLFVHDVVMVTAVRFLTAFFGLGVAYVLGLAMISRTANASRNFAITIVMQASYGGLGLFILPGFTAQFGLAAIVLPMAAFCLLGVWAALLMPQKALTASAASVPETYTDGAVRNDGFGANWRVFAGLFIQAFWYLGIGALWAFVEVIGTNAGLEHTEIGTALAICTVAGVSGALLASWFGDRAGSAAPFALPVLAQGLLAWVFLGSESWSVFLLAALALQITWNFALPYLLGFIAHADEGRGLAVLIPAAQGVGVASGPIIAGALYDASGIFIIIASASAVSLLSAVLFFPLGRSLAPQQAD